MRYTTRSPLFYFYAFIPIIVIALLFFTITPAYADGDPPPDPSPTTESAPATEEPQVAPPEDPTTDTTALEETEAPGEPPEAPAADATTLDEAEAPVEPPEAPAAATTALEETEAPVELMAETGEVVEAEPAGDNAPASDEGEVVPLAVIPEAEVTPVSSDADPYFTIGINTYRFSSGATYCDDNYPGDSNCTQDLANPIQAAITDLRGRGTPNDGTIYVENGTYTGDNVINGTGWTGGTPSSLTLQSLNGSAVTTIQGGVTIQNMLNFRFHGFAVTGGIIATGNTGILTLSDVIVNNTLGTGITVNNHDGDVVLDSVQANSNANVGASIDNTTGSGDVTITDSQFNDNNTTAAGGQQGGLEVNSDGTVTLENVAANDNLDGDGASITADTVTVIGGNYSNNTSPTGGYGNGIAAQSTGGTITVHNATASNNEESGALLWYPASAADPANLITVKFSRLKDNGDFGVWAQPESGTVILKCNCTSGNGLGGSLVPVGETVLRYACPDKEEEEKGSKHKSVGVLLSEKEPKIVNATNGVLVTFPPIHIIDPEELAIGKVWPRKEYQLPAEIPEEDAFMAGVEVQMLNAEFIEGLEDGELLIEFFIAGYLVDREFSVMWWDLEAEKWVEVPFEFVPHFRLPGGKITVRWPETGTFILVLHPDIVE